MKETEGEKSASKKRSKYSRYACIGVLASGLIVPTMNSNLFAANCPPLTVKDDKGIASQFPYQFELEELEKKASCTMAFNENPSIKELNARITGNPGDLPPTKDRLPVEPLIYAPYDEIGVYGGAIKGLSKGTESGTSDLLSIRHVNFVRYSDDLKTIVPNIAKGWKWNDSFTELIIELRKGHKWSDGEPFTAEDVVFWYEDLILDKNIYEKVPDRWLFAGEPMKVSAVDDTTVKFTFPVPNPGILNRFAVDFGQPFQPKHFLKKFHGKYNPKADELAKEKGLKKWSELIKKYYNGSDWKDVPTPLLSGFDKQVVPTLESHIVVEDTPTGRVHVSNPYFHIVDTAGNQLPYINEIVEEYVKDKEVQNLKIANGEVTFKQQAVFIEDFPLLKENEKKGGYKVYLAPALGENIFYAFNTTVKDETLRKIFNDIRFRQAMALALNREEINEIVFLGQAKPMQSTPVEPSTVSFITDEMKNAFIDYNPEKAKKLLKEMGLKDTNGDSILERPDGKPLVIRLLYSNQGGPVRLHELTRDYWSAIGIRLDLKEVSSDEYRAAGNNNDLELTTWKNDGTSGPSVSQDYTPMVPPFGDYFNPGTGFGWAAWKSSEGKDGIEPPADVKELYKLAEKFIQVPVGSEESNTLGAQITRIHVDNLWKIGTVGEVINPVMYSSDLGNYKEFAAKTYDFYWTYPYRSTQWFLKK